MERVLIILITCVVLVWIAVKDMREKKIPNSLLGVLAIFSMCVYPELTWGQRIGGSICVSAFLLLFVWLRPGSFGAGDVKLMAVSGWMIGLERNISAFVFAVGMAAVYCVCEILGGNKSKYSIIAFGPFLCMGILLALFWGDAFIEWYMKN